jgi:hypothetical protein
MGVFAHDLNPLFSRKSIKNAKNLRKKCLIGRSIVCLLFLGHLKKVSNCKGFSDIVDIKRNENTHCIIRCSLMAKNAYINTFETERKNGFILSLLVSFLSRRFHCAVKWLHFTKEYARHGLLIRDGCIVRRSVNCCIVLCPTFILSL